MRVAGYVSRKNIRRWLNNYLSLESGDIIDDGQVRVVNSGPKNMDGVSAGRLNKIMLDDAIAKLSPLKRRCVEMRWTKPIRVKEACTILGISYKVFQNRCDLAVEEIHSHVNGLLVNYMALAAAIGEGQAFDQEVVQETAAAAQRSGAFDNA